MGMLHLCHSKCGPWAGSIGLPRNVSAAEPWPTLALLSPNQHFNKMPRAFVCAS